MHKFKIIIIAPVVALGITFSIALAQSEFPFLYHAHDASGQLQKAIDTVNDRAKSVGITNDTDRLLRGDNIQVSTNGASLGDFRILDGTNLVFITADSATTNAIDNGITTVADQTIRADQVQISTNNVSVGDFRILDGTNLVFIPASGVPTNVIDADITN